MEYEVKFIAKRYKHHSDHSGYYQLARRLGSVIEPLNQSSLRDKWIPGRVAVRLAARSGVKHYSYLDFYDEWAAARDMFRNGRNTVYHILHADGSYRYLGNIARVLQSRLVATFHRPPATLRQQLRCMHHLRKLHGLIVVGTNQIPFFESIVDPERIFWVPHGVDTTVFCPASDTQYRLDTHGVCLFVGIHLRDFEILRQVIELVWAQDRYVRFVLVTFEAKFGFFAELENVDLRCGLSEPELIKLYQSADLLLQPLQDSTANNAILEGLSCGLPVVSTDIGGARDYMDQKCGVLVPPKDSEAMADAVLNLLGDETTRRQMATCARTRALQFDWSVVAEQTRQVYSQVLA